VTRMIRLLTVSALVVVAGAGLYAQESQPAPAGQSSTRTRPPKVPVKLTLVFSRFQGEKKLSSVPYMVPVTANDSSTSIRMGTRIPVVSTVFGAAASGGVASVPQSSYTYQNVGTEIDCSATTLDDGAFLITLTVTDSSVYYPDKSESAAMAASATTGAPAFRNFSAKFAAVLRDGQTTQYVAATDPVSGQVVKIDATLNLLK
jgi:hypothetical protein